MFVVGLIMGMLIGGSLGAVVSALCVAAHRGDIYENDKDL